ncbi:MAG: amidohydrolase [Pseudomonadota bacterium]
MAVDGKADLVLKGGRVWCGLDLGAAEALAVKDGRVMAAGLESEIEVLVGPATEVIDLRGRLAMPGFYDAHMHLMSLGRAAQHINLRASEVNTLDGLLERVAARAAQTPPGDWFEGRGYDHTVFAESRHPQRHELDQVAPDNPVWLGRCCGHMGVANSAALKLAGIDRDTPQPDGGVIEKVNGEPTGLLQERAQVLVRSKIPTPSLEDLMAAVQSAGERCLSYGITSVMDACVGAHGGWRDVEAYEEAAATGRLPVRMYMGIAGGPDGIADQAYAKGRLTGTGNGRLTVGPIKFFTDGSAGGCTAAMRKPYSNGADGVLILEDRDLDDMVAHYHDRGYQIAIHAIGDAAVDQTIQALDRALARLPRDNHRHRIEHCGWVDDANIQRMIDLGLTPAPQPIFMRDFGDSYLNVLGEERSAWAYPMAHWQRVGLKPAMSSDTPVSDVNPFVNLYAALTRETSSGHVIGGDQALTLEEALSAYTENGAHAGFAENHRGRLSTGMAADIAIVDRDIFERPAEELFETEVDGTLMDGAFVFDRHQEFR